MKVLKFGGSSVQDAKNISAVIDIILESKKTSKVLVVVSAMGGITNLLIDTANKASIGNPNYIDNITIIEKRHKDIIETLISDTKRKQEVLDEINNLITELKNILQGIFLLKEISARTMDLVMSFGERLSAFQISKIITAKGIPAKYLDSRDVIRTDETFGYEKVKFDITNKLIQEAVKEEVLFIATGFIAKSEKGQTTTLGRSGSDYSGAIFAGAVQAELLEIWTDVDGMMTADPRKVSRAYPIAQISYSEAMELSHFGAKVLEPRTIQPAISQKIPIVIKNTFNPKAEGTLITDTVTHTTGKYIRGISSIDQISLITVQGSGMKGETGIAMRLFKAIAQSNSNIILITQCSSEHSITFAVMPADENKVIEAIQHEFNLELQLGLIDPLIHSSNYSAIAAVGEGMKNTPGISARLFNALGYNGINVNTIAQGASELNITIVIDKKDNEKALNAIHESFFLSEAKTLNVFVIGTGVVGGALVRQIHSQQETLLQKNAIDIKVAGILNLDGFYINPNGIDLTCWEQIIKEKGDRSGLDTFINKIIDFNLRNTVVVDNTASYEVADKYELLFQHNISVVTPNKIANASDYKRYEALHRLVRNSPVRFLYETNVGAGLPVISTLKDLINSGDQILKIEAIVSGSLNYIFSAISTEKDFATAVAEARAKGYTEPDPKIDLQTAH
ncbi:MAG: bifunctional aspartate kinase/homoserine dehydrogenase I, partial [Bacteroidales bacterium]